MYKNDMQIRQKIIKFGDKIDEISRIIRKGGVIILPAKTIYGLSCRFDEEAPLKRIYDIKNRKEGVPFIILISRLEDLSSLVLSLNESAMKLISFYWDKDDPDPLTVIFKKNLQLPDYVTGGRDTIAIRRAEFKFIRDVIDNSYPVVSTSATISGIKANPVDLDDIPAEILEKADLIVDMGKKLLGTESTIVDTTGSDIKLVREGAVSLSDILQKLQIKI
ncbi:threonylcarbamoyl-AMP synthase [bacterium]|nr:threonylcarbamoyl-AMP synthase [bacterium]